MDAKISIVSKRRSRDTTEVVVDFVVTEGPHLPPRIIEKIFSVPSPPNIPESEINRLALVQATEFFGNAFPIRD